VVLVVRWVVSPGREPKPDLTWMFSGQLAEGLEVVERDLCRGCVSATMVARMGYE
jgi:hypothetical protein